MSSVLLSRIHSKSRCAPRVDVRWWPLGFRLLSRDPHVLRWFHHHLYTVAALTGEEPLARVSVRAVVDEGLTTEIQDALVSVETAPVEGYVGNLWTTGTVAGLRTWCHGAPPDRSDTAHVLVSIGLREWLVAGRNAATVAVAAVRTCRELIRTELARQDAYTVHASFATSGEYGGLLFVGAAGAGKTTIALAVARAGGSLVSGDQTELIVLADGRPLGVGFPWVVRLGFGTLARMGVDRAVESTPLLRRQPAIVDGRVVPEARGFLSLRKIELSMLEMDALLATPPADCAPVDALVMMNATRSTGPLWAGRATLTAAADDLRDAFREPDPAFASLWLAPPDEQLSDRRPFDTLRASLSQMPVVRLVWNPERDSTTEALDAVRGALRIGSRESAP